MYGQVGFLWSGETSKTFQYEQRLYLKAIIWGKPSPDHGQVQNRKTFFVLLRGSWHNGQVRGWSAVLEMPSYMYIYIIFFYLASKTAIAISWEGKGRIYGDDSSLVGQLYGFLLHIPSQIHTHAHVRINVHIIKRESDDLAASWGPSRPTVAAASGTFLRSEQWSNS